MADLTFVGVTATNDGTLTSATHNTAAPGGASSGHLDLVFVSAGVITGGGAPTLSMGAGWAEVATFTFTNQGGLDGRLSVFRRTGSTVQTETITASANSAWTCDRLVYSGQLVGSEITVTPILGLNAAGTAQVIPSITTTFPRSRTIYQVTGLSAASSWTPPGAVTERSDHNSACTGDALEVTPGATGTRTFTAAVSNITIYAVVVANSDYLRLSAQPANQTVNNGVTANFSVTATGGTPTYTYQWQDDSSGSFANIGGATSSTYSPVASYSMQGRRYRCIVTDAIGSTFTSNEASLTVAWNLTGTGPRSYPVLGTVIGAGTAESYIHDTLTAGGHSTTGALAAQAATIAGTAAHSALHATSGALSAQAAAIAGAAAHLTLHTTTGALSAQASTIAGAASRGAVHATTGALNAQAATIAGAAQHQHAATGALSSQAATVAGAASHLTLHSTSGALSAQAATVAGTAQHQRATSGALSAQAAAVAGSAAHTTAGASHGTTGALSADSATVAGSATHLTLHATSGALQSQSATVSGAAAHPHTNAGALQADASAVSGAASHFALHSTTGALSAEASTVSGAAAHQHAATGALQSQAATLAGSASRATAGTHAATGALQAGDAAISGVAEHVGLPPVAGTSNAAAGGGAAGPDAHIPLSEFLRRWGPKLSTPPRALKQPVVPSLSDADLLMIVAALDEAESLTIP